MTYETAKKLKDAGFPKEGGWYFLTPDGEYKDAACANEKPEDVFPPDLSELIEACGDKFVNLERDHIDPKKHASFVAWGKIGGNVESYGYSITPEEAVADLWLALNDKKPVDNLAL